MSEPSQGSWPSSARQKSWHFVSGQNMKEGNWVSGIWTQELEKAEIISLGDRLFTLHWVTEHWGSCSPIEYLTPASLDGKGLQLRVFMVVVEVKAVSLLGCWAGHCSIWWWFCPQACSMSCCHGWLKVVWDNKGFFLLQVVRGRRKGCCENWTFGLTPNTCSYEPLVICVVKFSQYVGMCTLLRLVGCYFIEQLSAMLLSSLVFLGYGCFIKHWRKKSSTNIVNTEHCYF